MIRPRYMELPMKHWTEEELKDAGMKSRSPIRVKQAKGKSREVDTFQVFGRSGGKKWTPESQA